VGMTRQFAAALAWSAAVNWSGQVIAFLVYVLLARNLGPEAYDVFGMTMVVAAVAHTLLIDGPAVFLVRAPELETGHIDAVSSRRRWRLEPWFTPAVLRSSAWSPRRSFRALLAVRAAATNRWEGGMTGRATARVTLGPECGPRASERRAERVR
jgi:hypothetical protein